MYRFISLIAGVLFGMGMAISGMVKPENVIAFLDVAGEWSPNLAFVMGGALAVFAPAYLLVIKPRTKPVLTENFSLSVKTSIDVRLISGAVLFGIGWGLAGICPGPAVASLGAGNAGIALFFASMMLGLGIANLGICIYNNRQSSTEAVTES